MARLAPNAAVALMVLAAGLPLQARANGDMFDGVPNVSTGGKSDMVETPAPAPPGPDLFPVNPPAAPARDMFSRAPLDEPSDDMVGHSAAPPSPGFDEKFSAHGMPEPPPGSLFNNPNEPGR